MASLPPVEYAYSCSSKRVVFKYKWKDGKIKCIPNEPEVVAAPPLREKLSKDSYTELQCTERISQIEDEKEHEYPYSSSTNYNINRKILLKNFQVIENDPEYNQFLHQARTLPKVYDGVYPVMLNELIKPNQHRTLLNFLRI